MLKTKRFRSENYRRWIASLPCLVSKIEGRTQCAHIRSGLSGGMGLKPGDNWCVPLSWSEHARQHQRGERKFWEEYGGVLRAKETATALFEIYNGEHRKDRKARELISRF